MFADRLPVVVGADGSDTSLAALRWAVAEAGARSAPLQVVQVLDPRAGHRAPYAQAAARDTDPADRAGEIDRLIERQLIDMHAVDGVRRVFEVGAPAEVLLKHAAGARTLVLGHAVRSGGGDGDPFQDAPALGAVARACVAHSTCPVVVVPIPIPIPGRQGTVMTVHLVRDAMTKDVVTVRSYAPFRELVQTMLARDIGAIPVVDSMGHAIGIVSRTELIARGATGRSGRSRTWGLLSPRGRKARARSEASNAARLMTRGLVTVGVDAGVARAAYLMQRHGITHLPVVDERNLVVGIISRGDLLRVYLRDDAEIREDVIRDVLIDGLDAERDTIDVVVDGGIVTLSGTLDHASAAAYAVRMARAVPGVVDVVGELHWQLDDTVLDDTVLDDTVLVDTALVAPGSSGPLF